MAQYWVAALNRGEAESAEAQLATLKSRLGGYAQYGEIWKFDVPANLAFKSFDSLIRLVDELAKNDPQVESTLRRVEKQLREFIDNPDFAVVSRGRTYTWKNYMQEFQWDEAKYPKTRGITENLNLMMTTVAKLDEEVRTKLATFNETKTVAAAMAKEGTYAVQELIFVITPDKVAGDDFVETEHLTTVVVVCPKEQDKELLDVYESLDNFVVPETMQKLARVEPDKDGNTLYRVVLFKKSVASFRAALGSKGSGKRFMVREFTYSKQAFMDYDKKRAALTIDLEKQESMCKMVCKAAFADMFLSWMHIKAMRTFVESVLRYGVGKNGSPHFGAVMMRAPTAARGQAQLRAELAELAGAPEKQSGDDDDEFYPYVWVSLTPLSQD